MSHPTTFEPVTEPIGVGERPIARARGHRGTYPRYGRSLLGAGEGR